MKKRHGSGGVVSPCSAMAVELGCPAANREWSGFDGAKLAAEYLVKRSTLGDF
ncbi:hypothetical protein WN943_008949 [Citrus x changshan-huyou]